MPCEVPSTSSNADGRGVRLPINLPGNPCVNQRLQQRKIVRDFGGDPSITIEHIHVKSHSGNKGHRRRGAILASRQRQTKEMIMTKYTKVLVVAALSAAVAHPALAHCGSPHTKTSRSAVAPKKPAVAGLRTAPTAQAATAETAPSGLSSELLGG
jgi:hypothetical protein